MKTWCKHHPNPPIHVTQSIRHPLQYNHRSHITRFGGLDHKNTPCISTKVLFWPCGNTKWAPTNGSFGTSFGGLRAAGAAPYMHSCIPPHNCDSMGATGPCSCAWAHAEACACISCSNTAGSGGHGILMPFDRFFAFFRRLPTHTRTNGWQGAVSSR